MINTLKKSTAPFQHANKYYYFFFQVLQQNLSMSVSVPFNPATPTPSSGGAAADPSSSSSNNNPGVSSHPSASTTPALQVPSPRHQSACNSPRPTSRNG